MSLLRRTVVFRSYCFVSCFFLLVSLKLQSLLFSFAKTRKKVFSQIHNISDRCHEVLKENEALHTEGKDSSGAPSITTITALMSMEVKLQSNLTEQNPKFIKVKPLAIFVELLPDQVNFIYLTVLSGKTLYSNSLALVTILNSFEQPLDALVAQLVGHKKISF